jgi:hypothetical protein
VDFGAHRLTPDDDYPDSVIPLGEAVAAGKVDRSAAVCAGFETAKEVSGLKSGHDHPETGWIVSWTCAIGIVRIP